MPDEAALRRSVFERVHAELDLAPPTATDVQSRRRRRRHDAEILDRPDSCWPRDLVVDFQHSSPLAAAAIILPLSINARYCAGACPVSGERRIAAVSQSNSLQPSFVHELGTQRAQADSPSQCHVLEAQSVKFLYKRDGEILQKTVENLIARRCVCI